MSTTLPLPGVAGSPLAGLARPTSTTSTAREFQQVLEALTVFSTSSFSAPQDTQSAGGLDLLGSSAWGGGEALMQPLLTLVLLQALERLLDSAEAPDEAQETLKNQPEPSGLPVAGRISQHYHDGHRAVDIAVPVGTPIQSTMAGTVTHAGWNNQGYGNLVIVENGAYRTYYAHLDSIPVGIGQRVLAGEVIGLPGNTGNSTGPHLHYEVRVDGVHTPPPVAP